MAALAQPFDDGALSLDVRARFGDVPVDLVQGAGAHGGVMPVLAQDLHRPLHRPLGRREFPCRRRDGRVKLPNSRPFAAVRAGAGATLQGGVSTGTRMAREHGDRTPMLARRFRSRSSCRWEDPALAATVEVHLQSDFADGAWQQRSRAALAELPAQAEGVAEH
jgi:hypothetical protein